MRTHKEKVNSKLTFEMLTDVSKIFGDVFVQTAFDSFESFSELLHQFMNRTGYIYRIKSSCNANDHNKYRDKTRSQALRYVSVTFVCTQYGKPKDNSNTNRLKMHCKPVGCKSFLSLSSAKGLLRITKSNLEHNHKPLVGFSRSKIRRCKLSKEEIEEIAALNQHNSKYRVTRKRKQPISVTVPTSSDSHLLPPVTDDQTKPIEDHLIKKHKNNDFNDGQSDGRNNVEMVEKPQQFPSIPASNPKMEKVENIAQTVQFSVSSVQNLISQPEPVEKSQLPCEKFVLGVHKMSNQVSVWKNGKSCNSGTGNSSHAVMARSLNQNKAKKNISIHQRKSPSVSSNPVIIPDEPHCPIPATKIPKRLTAARTFEKHQEKEQYCQGNTSVGREMSGDSHVSKMAGNCQEITSQIAAEKPICVIKDVGTVSQSVHFSMPPVLTSIKQPKTFEMPQPHEKKIFILADHQKNVMSSLTLLWKSGKLCDAGIGNGTSTVMMHKVVLAAVCPKLLSVFGADMLSHKFLQINLPQEVSKEGLTAFAEYAYNGILDLDPDILQQLKIIAKQLDMSEFEYLCDSQLATALHHPQYHQMPVNASVSSNITITPIQPSSSKPLSTNTTDIIDIKDDICEVELTQHNENTNIAIERESEVSSLDVGKNRNSSTSLVVIPSVQTKSLEPVNSIYSQQNHNISHVSKRNLSTFRISRTSPSDSLAVPSKVFAVPFSDTTDNRATSNVQKSNMKSKTSESSLANDLSPVSCIVQKMCSQPSLIGRNFYKPFSQSVISRKSACSFGPFTSRRNNVSLSPQVNDISIDLTDELT
ncbi:uncharacterized protein LOC106877743 [Octopus bimaculoides]|uniref:uncharacterized protein LOC106877743 n=1 Tax=Octopus bimaculoides TaxID=37653 RepID=UPI00071D8ACC|nr:uncharacterized protein LOC106877743 [Octopus bimaculoides]|eukprot:XP_014782235.1 PREDICTED: uncharacterized protein LOC106877743 [Octopus bimaculoides]